MADTVTLAPMDLEHLREVLDLGNLVFDVTLKPYTSWSLTAIAEHLDTDDNACWVALDAGRVVGFVLGSMEFEFREDWAYLEWIAVAPDHQGRGIARRLVDACCHALFARGAGRVVADVEAGNTASATLMTNQGFQAVTTVTLFVRSNPDELTPEEPALPLPPGTKRALIRSGRLTGDAQRGKRDR
ncbi:GNAT family N-acetyltransferase [Nocardia stercoris]|uniref:GNAT family N-acetyltransferase n=1 Tax=Nocardia stercoris TaxID=2483361 RepID=A0A3M2L1G0_9NOCA|nr:GNAT family N-acetyltransferase [Nocardia stercoris]RMI30570.1 GNAT family N-acetyltransferase [Nocardia stercoris]